MKINKIIICGLLYGVITLSGCSTKTPTIGNYTFKTECVRANLDGSQSLIAWGNGENKEDAIENAQRKALRDLIFKGINEGKPECNSLPLLLEVNATSKHQAYFEAFFAHNGPYKNFISVAKQIKSFKISTDKNLTYGIEVRVATNELKQKMISDGILKN